jgi:hypothetical protein
LVFSFESRSRSLTRNLSTPIFILVRPVSSVPRPAPRSRR